MLIKSGGGWFFKKSTHKHQLYDTFINYIYIYIYQHYIYIYTFINHIYIYIYQLYIYIQGGAPKIAKLVYNSNNYGL